MKNKLGILFTLLFVSVSAQAVDFEVGVGKTARTNDASYSVGITGTVFDGWRWRLGYANTGTPVFNRVASATAAWDDIYLAGGPQGQYIYLPVERNHGLYFTAGPEFKYGDVTYSPYVGVLRYNPQWIQECLAALGTSCTEAHSKRTNYTGLIGVSVAQGPYIMAIEATNVNYWGDWEDKSPTSGVYTMWLRRRF